MGDQTKGGGPEQGGQQMTMAEYQQQVSMAQGPTQVQVSMSQASQLPTLAPAPQGHGQQMHTAGGPVMHNMQGPGGPQPGQAQLAMQQAMGQPQFQVIQQPSFAPGGQYATFPQFATYNQQGQLVLQPAMLGPGQQQGQVILSALPQKPGQPPMIGGQPQPGGKPGMNGQPSFTINSSGMPGQPTQPGQQTFIMAPQMGGPSMSAVPVSMPSQGAPQAGQVVHTSMGNKVVDNKPGMPSGPPQHNQSQQQPQFILPPGMAYMQAGPQQILQNGQIIFRGPGPQDQPLMFSPTGQPGQPGPPQAPGSQLHQGNVPPNANGQPMQGPGQMAMGALGNPGVRTSSIPSGAPPGKTAISRAIAPLLPTVSQSGPRVGYQGNQPGQPSPKSKQKMSPRGMQGIGPGRPPGSKTNQPNNQNMKTIPRMAFSSNNPLPQQPGSPLNMNSGSPKPPMLLNSSSPGPNGAPIGPAGPPTLTPMMFPTQPTSIPPSIPASLSTSMPTFASMMPDPKVTQTTTPLVNHMVPTSAVAPTQHIPIPPLLPPDQGPPTLTKEISGPLMPNLGPPQISSAAPLPIVPVIPPTAQVAPAKPVEGEPNLTPTPKAVVKPQVLTHVIDGHIIKESSHPFPISSPNKNPAIRRKSEKDDKSPIATSPTPLTNTTTTTVTTNGTNPLAPTGPVKRGPGRPPGSTNNKQTDGKNKNGSSEPPEKRAKTNSGSSDSNPPESQPVAPLINGTVAPQVSQAPPTTPTQPPPVPCAPLTSPSLKNNPLKWNVTQVCDFIKNLPGCAEYVEDFALQEIDGQALMLLQADHLMTAMSIKLGPALKICEQVKQLKDDLNKN